MPAPSSTDEFLQLVRKSGVLEEKRLDSYLEKVRVRSTLPKEIGKVAGLLVRDGLLTHFQAEQFLQGRWKRFTIGKYKVLERIASGGMGSVYLCEHKFMRRRAAVKVLPTAKANDPSALERFYREARAVAALDHPNIVRAYDIDQEDDLHFLVMEYVDGTSLQDLLKKAGPLDPTRAAHYISQAALGLQHAHEVAGLVHRDIKPGNLIVDRGGTVKVLDMGLARFFHDTDDLLTQKYDENVLGTADYLAPEQALDSHGVDIRADIYSLGATFYFCLTGKTPFNDGTVAQKLIWHQTRQPKPLRSIRPEVPEGLAAVIEKMMAKDPAQRYQEPIEVAQALAPWTATHIPPPAEAEMPRLSPAANAGAADTGASLASTRPAAQPPSSKKQKAVPVRAKPTPAPAPKPVPAPLPVKRNPPTQATAPAVETAPAPPQDSNLLLLPTPPVLALAETAGPSPETAAAAVATPAEPPVPRTGSQEAAPPTLAAAPTPQPEDNSFFGAATAADTRDPEDGESLAWENLAIKDTQELNAHGDTLPRSPKPASSRRFRSAKAQPSRLQDRRRLWWVVGVAVLVLGVLAAWVAFSGDQAPPPDPKAQPARVKLTVNRSGKNAFKTVHDALQQGRSGPRVIVIQDDMVEEQLELGDVRQVTFEAEAGKKVVWRCPDKPAEGRPLLSLGNVEEVRFQGFTFDGRDLVNDLVLLYGNCPGLVLDHVELRGFKRYGVRVANCAGSSDRPVALLHVKTTTAREVPAAVAFELNPQFTNPKVNQYFTIRNCRFEGPYKTAVQLAQPGVLKDVLGWEGNVVQPQSGQPAVLIPAPPN